MPTRTVSKLKDGVAGFLTGTNLNNVTNLYNAFERAFRTFLQKAAVPEASNQQITTLYDAVFDYGAPPTIFGGALRDIRPVGLNRNMADYVYRKYISDFDRTKLTLPNGYNATFETVNGVPIMRIAQVKATKSILLDAMNQTTGWTAGGSLSSLVADASFFYDSNASLRFKLTGASSGYLEKTQANAVDLTSYQSVGVVFIALEIPTASLTSIELRLGSDAANYYSLSVTQGFIGAWTVGDFLLTAFDLSQASQTGTPVITAIDYSRITFTHSATMTNVRVGKMFIALPSQHKVIFESTAIFSSSGTLSNFITSDNDIILLNDAAYNIYEHECAIAVGLQQGGSIATGTLGNLNSQLNGARARNGQIISLGLYDLYRAANPSEDLREIGNFYLD